MMKPRMNDEIQAVLAGESQGCVLCGDCLDMMKEIPDGAVDIALTDPPFSRDTHTGARSKGDDDHPSGHIAIDFESCDVSVIRQAFAAAKAKRWVVSFIDWQYALPLKTHPPDGLKFIRLGAWIKLNPMPQLTGDRPGQGWEAIAILHPPGVKRWNGGGSSATWVHGTSRYGWFGPSSHPTEKPLSLVSDMVEKFSDAGELILDPFCGSGTTLVAAKMLGRRYIGIDISQEYVDVANARLQAVDTSVPHKEAKNGQMSLFRNQKS